MNENRGQGGIVVVLALVLGGYAALQAIDRMMKAFGAFLMGLVWIALVLVAVAALLWLYRYVTNKEYGQERNMREAQKLEEKRIWAASQAPEHMKEGIDEWYRQRQQAIYHTREESRFDLFADRIKQLLNLRRNQ